VKKRNQFGIVREFPAFYISLRPPPRRITMRTEDGERRERRKLERGKALFVKKKKKKE